jgi:GTPase SAR1 family protein
MDPWTLPAAGIQAYKHRKEIGEIWSAIAARLGKKSRIAVTGMAGVGKTLLVDHLSGSAYDQDYKPPGQSRTVEKTVRTVERRRLALTAIPGDPSAVRLAGFSETFRSGKPVSGVVHVVANGYTAKRAALTGAAVRERGITTLEEYRANERAQELDDLRETCSGLRDSMNEHHQPTWMVIAVNKVDLFTDDDELTAAQRHYTAPDGEFVAVLSELADKVGSDNFRWEARPACGWLEPFTWGERKIPSLLDRGQQSELVRQLAVAMKQHATAI